MKQQRGTAWIVVAIGGLFLAIIWLLVAFAHAAEYRNLTATGVKVRGVVSEKHLVKSDQFGNPDRGGRTPKGHNRVFFLPAPDFTPEQAERWSQTSAAYRYPNSVSLFDDWGNRLWEDVTLDRWKAVRVGDEFDLWIDGKISVIDRPGGIEPSAWIAAGVAFAVGVGAIFMAIRARRQRQPTD